VLRRAVDKWLKAGVFERGVVTHPELGTPQGGVISPLLANVYLHHVLDVWFEDEVRPRLRGRVRLVRFADDLVVVCEREDDARRVLAELPERFASFGLTLHREKTCLVRFERPSLHAGPKGRDGKGNGPGTFDFLGFTHLWCRTRRGGWAVKRRTAKSRLRRALLRVTEWCRDHRHFRVPEQRQTLSKKLQGHYGYYGITGNSRMLDRFYLEVCRVWWKWLNRRSQHKSLGWAAYLAQLKRHPLPAPVIVHSDSYRSKSVARRAGCGNSARPDLWGR
jgi:hypothetical protein